MRIGSRDGISALLIRRDATALSLLCEDTARRQLSASREVGSHQNPTTPAPASQPSSLQNCLRPPGCSMFLWQPALTQTPKLRPAEMGLCCHWQPPQRLQHQQALPLPNTPDRTGHFLFVLEHRRLWRTGLFLPVELRTQVLKNDGFSKPSSPKVQEGVVQWTGT